MPCSSLNSCSQLPFFIQYFSLSLFFSNTHTHTRPHIRTAYSWAKHHFSPSINFHTPAIYFPAPIFNFYFLSLEPWNDFVEICVNNRTFALSTCATINTVYSTVNNFSEKLCCTVRTWQRARFEVIDWAGGRVGGGEKDWRMCVMCVRMVCATYCCCCYWWCVWFFLMYWLVNLLVSRFLGYSTYGYSLFVLLL